ncbi:MAG: ABC transporter family substrate-binding protein, partial [Pseudonocardiaceae bacterium]
MEWLWQSRVRCTLALVALVLTACGGGGAPGGSGQRQTGSAFAGCDTKPNTCNSAAPDTLRQGGQLTYA